MCIFAFIHLNTAYLISDIFSTCNQTTEKAMSFFKCPSSDCSDTPVEDSSDEKISIDDLPEASLSGFQKAK
ncbi:hypothetical protein NPIL_189521, partial [Nephila pilipes]